jgi:uncharacterized iron-regulated membrane protein
MKLRRAIFVIHKYLGLTIGTYVLVICATGATLILLENRIDGFRDYPVVHVQASSSTKPLGDILATVQHAYPGKRIAHVLKSCERGCTCDVTLGHGDYDRTDVLVNPYTGSIVQSVSWTHSAVGFLYNFHADLLSGDTGGMVNGVVALVAVSFFLTGLYLWPGWIRISRGFSIKWPADGWRLNFDLHKVIGLVAVAFLVFIVLTGASGSLLAEPEIGAPFVAAPSHPGKPLPLDALVGRADTALPGTVTMIYPADAGSALVRIRKIVAGDPDPYGWSNVWVDQYTGRIAVVHDITTWSPWWRFYTWLYPLHIGAVGGDAVRYLYVILGLTPIALYYTGFVMWLNRLKRDEGVASARVDRRAPPAEPQAAGLGGKK